MEILLIIGIALLAIIAVILLFNFLGARKLRQTQADDLADRTYQPRDPFSSADEDAVHGDPRTLVPGDLIEIRGQTYAVRGTLRLAQDGYTWTENFIDTGLGRKAWISVEDDPDLEVVWWEEVSGVELTPGVPSLVLDGRRYSHDEHGSARFTSVGTTGLAPSGVMGYHDYAAGTDRLSFEDFGSGWECARGQLLDHAEYRIYPQGPTAGSGQP